MTLAAIAAILAWFSVAGCVLLFGFMAATFHLLRLHHKHRAQGMAAEAAALAAPLPPEHALPDVVIQIPVFNEGAMVRRAAKAAAALDWPRVKLHVQILDDSTDATPELSRAAADELRAAGIDAVVLHRTDRVDFKAGALREAMERVPYQYFAIFDVDYVPPPDFLRRAMRPLLADPKLAFVQGRYDYLNPDENRMTELQVVLQDAHLGVEQATRSWAGHPLPFNGTCGIWRRAAIDEAGGWRGESLAEDLELTYRAWLKGWRGRFLVTVSAPGELPASLKAWTQQQRRWTKGFGQVARRMLPILATRRGLSAKSRLDSFLHLISWFSLPISNLTVYAGIAAMILNGGWVPVLAPLLVALIASGYFTMYAFLRTGNRFIRGDAWSRTRFLRVFLRIIAIGFYAGFAQTRAYWDALVGRKSAFVRTPKRGAPEAR